MIFAAAALGLCDTNTYEGQCAATVEQAARRASGAYLFDPACTPRELLEEMQCQKADVPALALGLHHWLARWILNQAQAYRRKDCGALRWSLYQPNFDPRTADLFAAQRLHRLYRLQGAPR